MLKPNSFSSIEYECQAYFSASLRCSKESRKSVDETNISSGCSMNSKRENWSSRQRQSSMKSKSKKVRHFVVSVALSMAQMTALSKVGSDRGSTVCHATQMKSFRPYMHRRILQALKPVQCPWWCSTIWAVLHPRGFAALLSCESHCSTVIEKPTEKGKPVIDTRS